MLRSKKQKALPLDSCLKRVSCKINRFIHDKCSASNTHLTLSLQDLLSFSENHVGLNISCGAHFLYDEIHLNFTQ